MNKLSDSLSRQNSTNIRTSKLRISSRSRRFQLDQPKSLLKARKCGALCTPMRGTGEIVVLEHDRHDEFDKLDSAVREAITALKDRVKRNLPASKKTLLAIKRFRANTKLIDRGNRSTVKEPSRERLLLNPTLSSNNRRLFVEFPEIVTGRKSVAVGSIERYLGTVVEVLPESVRASVTAPGDYDRWDVLVPLNNFDRMPAKGDKFEYRILQTGPFTDSRASILLQLPALTKEEIMRKEQEFLDRLAKLDV